jgi:hypothetical protein
MREARLQGLKGKKRKQQILADEAEESSELEASDEEEEYEFHFDLSYK